MRDLHVLCWGGGVNTIALLLCAIEDGIVFDAILFADPGDEKKKSYEYTATMNDWCVSHGQPPITTVRQVNKEGEFVGLYQYSLNSGTLPSIAYGYKSCSQKFKRFPQDKWCNNWPLAQQAWQAGYKVVKYIGFDADESHRTQKMYDDDKYSYKYLLVEKGIGRLQCIKKIIDAGLPIPPKSSCVWCPSSKVWEIIELYETDREAFYRGISMERVAAPKLTSVAGLGRSFSWWDLIVAYRYLKIIEKYGPPSMIPEKIGKLIKKIRRSIPIESPVTTGVEVQQVLNDLFLETVTISCECFDGNTN